MLGDLFRDLVDADEPTLYAARTDTPAGEQALEEAARRIKAHPDGFVFRVHDCGRCSIVSTFPTGLPGEVRIRADEVAGFIAGQSADFPGCVLTAATDMLARGA